MILFCLTNASNVFQVAQWAKMLCAKPIVTALAAQPQPSFVFDLIAVEPPTAATLALLGMPVKRKDTGEMVALGKFLAAVTASRMYTPTFTPAVTVVSWGKGADSSVFYQMIEALKLVGLCGGEWKAEGLGGEWEAGCSIQWVSSYAVAESTDSTYLDLSSAANADKVQGVMDAWLHHIVRPVAKDDALSFMIVATAKTPELADAIKESAKLQLVEHCFPRE